MSAIDDKPFPKGALYAAGGVVAVAMLAALAPRLGWTPGPEPLIERRASEAQVARSADLTFIDRPEGGVEVRAQGRAVAVLAPGEGQFTRGVLRSLARERRAFSIGAEEGFRLTGWSDGRLTLTDLATGRTVDVSAFGATNHAAFARLLAAAAPRQTGDAV